MLQDIRIGLRMLGKTPGLTAIILLTLAFGIGANTAAFSMVNTLLLDPLPFDESENLVAVGAVEPVAGDPSGLSLPELEDFRAGSRSFAGIAAMQQRTLGLSGDGEPERVSALAVTPNLPDVLRIQPLAGRLFHADETARGRDAVALLSHGFWRRRFGADTDVIGRTVVLDGRAVTVAGILPETAQLGQGPVDVWIPLPDRGLHAERGGRVLSFLGRLADGATVEQARAELADIAGRARVDFPEKNPPRITVETLHETVVRKTRTRLLLLQGAVVFVLAIACANVAGLLLARSAARRKETAVRSALGATRWRIARQMLAESFLIALGGGVLGVFVAYWLLDVLMAAAPDKVRGVERIAVDARVLGFTALLTCLTGIVFGIVPALRAATTNATEVLKDGGAASALSFARDRLRAGLVAGQIALGFMLLAGSMLLMRSFLNLEDVQPGFAPANAVAVGLALPETQYAETARVEAFYDRLIERIEASEGIESAGAIRILPLVGWNPGVSFETDTGNAETGTLRADYQTVTPGYFEAMGIPLVAGRGLREDAMGTGGESVVLVNARFAERLWPGAEAVGRRIRFEGESDWRVVAGVVGDVRQFGLDQEPRAEVYVAGASRTMTLVVRADGDPAAAVALVRAAVREIDPSLPVFNARTLERVVDDSLAVRRLYAIVFGVLATIAVLLAVMGIYGVVAYGVARRTREIGIRMALGARTADVVRLVFGQGLALVAVGVVLGVAGSAGVGRVLKGLLFGISAFDVVTLACAALVLAAFACAACLLPARRASAIEPIRALRCE